MPPWIFATAAGSALPAGCAAAPAQRAVKPAIRTRMRFINPNMAQQRLTVCQNGGRTEREGTQACCQGMLSRARADHLHMLATQFRGFAAATEWPGYRVRMLEM